MSVFKILLAVDGSESSIRTTRKLAETAGWYKEPIEVELVTVHLPLPKVGGFAGAVVSKDAIQRYYKDEGEKALASSRKVLEEAGIRCTASVLIGEVAEAIVDHADKSSCRVIYMGTRGLSAIASLALGSVTLKVLQLARIPVLLVR
jgi:nucleotide-binding universal stress UspA family protein